MTLPSTGVLGSSGTGGGGNSGGGRRSSSNAASTCPSFAVRAVTISWRINCPLPRIISSLNFEKISLKEMSDFIVK